MDDGTTTPDAGGPRLDLRSGTQRAFAHVLVNGLLVSVVNFTLWFAVTFWVYLETRSVFATGLIAGIFLVATASTGIWFGSIVDHHRKQRVLQASAATSLAISSPLALCQGPRPMRSRALTPAVPPAGCALR